MNNVKIITKQFGDNAENYVKSEMHAKGLDLQYLVQQLKKNNRLLDIATGGGHVYGKLIVIFLCSSTMFKMRQLILLKKKQELSEYKAIGMIQDHLHILYQSIQQKTQEITKIEVNPKNGTPIKTPKPLVP
ncbi:hypothetical protein COL55_24720 [Bacillus toyonensis]|nr:hypothetical protein CN688_30400 [Bacillus toyonensis]PEL21354.1 hypothetical protein CN624_26145 [Bacillus toyonensis]PFY40184.1 hypothetical protein COL55_24720 [Bacillus toyonensis]PFY81516.1 hypothetical protein COL62_10455 [Bacillus toyonensis]PHA40713.1 hypothetical protein COE68_22550 [Bacillus toyonensis]